MCIGFAFGVWCVSFLAFFLPSSPSPSPLLLPLPPSLPPSFPFFSVFVEVKYDRDRRLAGEARPSYRERHSVDPLVKIQNRPAALPVWILSWPGRIQCRGEDKAPFLWTTPLPLGNIWVTHTGFLWSISSIVLRSSFFFWESSKNGYKIYNPFGSLCKLTKIVK